MQALANLIDVSFATLLVHDNHVISTMRALFPTTVGLHHTSLCQCSFPSHEDILDADSSMNLGVMGNFGEKELGAIRALWALKGTWAHIRRARANQGKIKES